MAMSVAYSTDQPAPAARAGAFAAPIAAAAAAATAVWVQTRARLAESAHPPCGKFRYLDGARLHYLDRGTGPEVVLLHGNSVSLADYQATGLIDRLSRDHRVIAFDRPGFGHSTRPRDRLWTPSAQAALLARALAVLDVHRAVVIGHSMGALVALAMALDAPTRVGSLVLIGGYYYPAPRLDALLSAPLALPVLGDVMRYTVAALAARATLNGLVREMFAPAKVPAAFFPALAREMMLRPLQLRADAEDSAFMMPAARALSARYGRLTLPVTVIAGAQDRIVSAKAHTRRLHAELPQSHLVLVPRSGHMVHHAAPDAIMAAVEASLR